MERDRSAFGNAKPLIFPYPRKVEMLEGRFLLNEQVVIISPENPSQDDVFLTRTLTADLTDRYQIALRTVNVHQVDENERFILMGSITNP